MNPANAILNYLYAILEAEATLACAAIGLDPGLGIFHADRKARASLALDVMEACRPLVDVYLLTLLRCRTFRRQDFLETSRGDCRVRPALAGELAQTLGSWREHVAPVAERVAGEIARSSAAVGDSPTRLTHANRRAAWEGRRSGPGRRTAALPTLPATCRACGEQLDDRRRRYCDRCRRQTAIDAGKQGRVAASAALQRLRDSGRDPAHGGSVAERRGRKNAAHQAAVNEWNEAHWREADRHLYRNVILPQLRKATIAELVAATGLSEHYCSLIRLGKRVPHQKALGGLAGHTAATDAQAP